MDECKTFYESRPDGGECERWIWVDDSGGAYILREHVQLRATQSGASRILRTCRIEMDGFWIGDYPAVAKNHLNDFLENKNSTRLLEARSAHP
jgi:hypothetical protein